MRLIILQIGTPLQYIFHHDNITGSFLVYLCVRLKSIQIGTFLKIFGTDLYLSIPPPPKKTSPDLCIDHVPLRFIILRNSIVLCATRLWVLMLAVTLGGVVWNPIYYPYSTTTPIGRRIS